MSHGKTLLQGFQLTEILSKRFKSKVLVCPDTGCWLWQGARKNGYGVLAKPRTKLRFYAHRLSFTLHKGEIPDGLYVCHHCDNPQCVNPEHLFLGTNADNMRDASLKGRLKKPHFKGEGSPRAILSACDVMAIRASPATAVELSKHYGVTRSTVQKARTGINWGSL